MSTLLPIIAGNLASGFCPSTYQEILQAFASVMNVSVPDANAQIIASASPPAASFQGKAVWLQLDLSGRPVRYYWFAAGAWLAPHPLTPGFTMIWPLALPEVPDPTTLGLLTYDGGDGSAVYGPISGPMWQLCKTNTDGTGTQLLGASFPLGVGTLPSGKAVTVQSSGGEENHFLQITEIPWHAHPENIAVNRKVANGGSVDQSGSGGFVGDIGDGGTELFSKAVGGDPTTLNAQGQPIVKAHNTMPPWTGVSFLMRTGKLFYVVPQ